MGNDNKMIIHKPEIKLFLSDEMYPETRTEAQVYDLEQEYEKTKKNRNHFVLLVLISLIILVIGITYGITSFIAYQNRKIDVDIDVFADANLIELFDMVSRTEEALSIKQSEKVRLEMFHQTELQDLESKREADLYALKNMLLTGTARTQREREIQTQYANDLAHISEQYNEDLAYIEKSIEEYQKQLESLDGSRVKQAQEQQMALDFQRNIYEMEKKQIQEDYGAIILGLREKLEEQQRLAYERQRIVVDEISKDYQSLISRLDPLVEDSKIDEIQAEVSEYIKENHFLAEEYRLDGDNDTYNALLNQIEHAYASIDYLAEIVATIPQENSIPSILQTIESIYYLIGKELSYFSSNEIQRLQNLLDETLLAHEEELALMEENYLHELEAQKNYYIEQLNEPEESFRETAEE